MNCANKVSTRRENQVSQGNSQKAGKFNTPYLVMASVSERNVSEMTKLAVQLTQVDVAMPVLRAHSG